MAIKTNLHGIVPWRLFIVTAWSVRFRRVSTWKASAPGRWRRAFACALERERF